MGVISGKDLMYGGLLKGPAASPNAITINSGDSFTITGWQPAAPGQIGPGGDVQLYIRQWTNGVGSTVLFQCWDGQTIWQYTGGPDNYGWSRIGEIGGSPTWSSALFTCNGGNTFTIIPQTGSVGGAVDSSFGCGVAPIVQPRVGNTTPYQVTLSGVNSGSGSGNIIIGVDIATLSR